LSEFLSNAWLEQNRATASVALPRFDRAAIRPGVVHLGPGAFHRAHQAPAFDAILGADPRWGITGVSLHSPAARDALAPQDGLFTLALLDEEESYRVIGSVLDILVAPEDPAAVLALMSAPETEIVTLTITEKGYCIAPEGGLDLDHPDIRADLEHPERPTSAIGYLVEALARRRGSGAKPLVAISCDNLVGNGDKLAANVWELAREQERRGDPTRRDLPRWLGHELVAPCTMVDSITPATDDATRARVAEVLGVADRWPVRREAFTQWVIAREPRLPELDWEAMGVTLADDVSAYERAKLRVLNASHSALAYLGPLRGHETVFDAVSDPELAAFVADFMREDVAPSLGASPGLDVPGYCAAVQKRFRNPAIRHLLSQIAWDGSQKLPNRLFPLIVDALRAGRPLDRPARILAGWFMFLRAKAKSGDKLVDPLAPQLLTAARLCSGVAEADVARFLALREVFPSPFAAQFQLQRAVVAAYADLLNRA
jgi:fructuronate reductase